MAVDITKPETKPSPAKGGVINLDKKGASLSLDKNRGFDKIVINLNWNQAKQKSGFFGSLFKSRSGVDLDIGCLYELKDGQVGCIQALGKAFGEYARKPFIKLLGDDRTGANADGEFIWINGEKFSDIKRVLVYAFIYEGVANWTETDGVITLSTPGHETIRVALDSHRDLPLCAVAMIENERGNLKMTKLVNYFTDQSTLDDAYEFGLNWSQGSK